MTVIKAFRLIRNIGCFDSFQGTPDTDFAPITLVYAENGRGKTTLGAILRSLATGNPKWIKGRRRIGSQHDPHVVLELEGDPQATVFQNDQWSALHESILIFDDQFVDDNVYSGLSIGAEHRQNLHEVILGSRGVTLARRVDGLTDQIARLNQELREQQRAIPDDQRFGVDVDTFCDLGLPDDVDDQINAVQKQVDAVNQSDRVGSARFFSAIEFPTIDLAAIDAILGRQLPDLDKEAVDRVQMHLERLGEEGETWVADGVPKIIKVEEPTTDELCPFCGQTVSGLDLVDKYRAYFGEAYRGLQSEISQAIETYELALSGDALAKCQRAITTQLDQYAFWHQLAPLPSIDIDFEALAAAWSAARDGVLGILSAKQSAPLEAVGLPPELRDRLAAFQDVVHSVTEQIGSLMAANDAITELKKSAESGDATLLNEELSRLKAAKARHSDEVAPLCEAYIATREAKRKAEQLKREARQALDTHRRQAFPTYKTKVNHYLQRFGAGFSLGDVQPQDRAGRPSTAYHLTIRDSAVPLVARGEDDSLPCFKNTLSAGDRNTLALAFFFAGADLDTELADKIIVIDDPVSSLDDGRMTTTVSEVRSLGQRSRQLVVLSHAKPFLCRILKHARADQVTCLSLTRCAPDASALAAWDATEDEFTQYDRRHKMLRDFQDGSAPNIRQVAVNLRPVLEGYLRVAFPKCCPPGTLLGQFRQRIQTQIDAGNQVVAPARLQELDEITDYANKFHHDTNPAWETEQISENELLGFVRRVLAFIEH